MVSSRTATEALAGMPRRERAWVEAFRDQVRARFGDRVRDLRLFGSQARGEGTDESDVDVLVLVDRLDAETRNAIFDIAFAISCVLIPLIRDFDRYHEPASRATSFYEEMRSESVRL